MPYLKHSLVAASLALLISGPPTMAGDNHNHAAMQSSNVKDEVPVKGVLNSVDTAAGTINVTHEPVEALGWPKMTMDLPVTRRVDMSKLKPGSEVTLKLKQGRDKQFRVVGIE